MRLGIATACLLFAVGDGVFAKPREPVAFFGFAPGEDPQFAAYFSERVYWEMSSDSALAPVPPLRWEAAEAEIQAASQAWRLEQYRALAKSAGARYFAIAFREPFRHASRRVWWKPWDVTVRTFLPLRLRVYGADADSALFDGVVAAEDSVKHLSPWPWRPPAGRADPVPHDAWRRESYAALAGPAVKAIRAAVSGTPPASAVFVAKPPKPGKGKKKG